MVWDVPRLGLTMFSVSKHLNRVEKIPHCCSCEQCQPEGFTVHVNSDMIFCVNFYVVE